MLITHDTGLAGRSGRIVRLRDGRIDADQRVADPDAVQAAAS